MLLFFLDQWPELQRLCRAEVRADRIATAKIAFREQIMNVIIERASKRARGRASRTLDAFVLIEFDRTGFLVQRQSAYET